MAYDESPGAGALFRLELDGSCTTVLTGLTISNGIGWSPDASTMYLNDSGTGCVEAFRFDGPSGAISDRRTLVHVDQPGVVPNGLTIDEEGGIWVALWNGGAVHQYAPDGSLLASVQLPVQRPTSCAFGGPGRDTLFVTSARTDLDDDALARQPHAGKVFAIDGLGVRGLPCMPYRGRITVVRSLGAALQGARKHDHRRQPATAGEERRMRRWPGVSGWALLDACPAHAGPPPPGTQIQGRSIGIGQRAGNPRSGPDDSDTVLVG